MFKKSMLAVTLLSSVLSSPSSAYFGESVINGAYDKASSAVSWVKENPGKTVAITAALTAAGYAAYWGYSSYVGSGAQAAQAVNSDNESEDLPKATFPKHFTNKKDDLPTSWGHDDVLNFFGIDSAADVIAEKKAWRQIAVKWHPDRCDNHNVFQKASAMHDFFRLARNEPRLLNYYKAISESDPDFFIDHLPTENLIRDYGQYRAVKEGIIYDPLAEEWLKQWRESENPSL